MRRAREDGITLPLHVGLAGPIPVSKLIRLGPQIGVGASVQFLAGQYGSAGTSQPEETYQPESLLRGMGDTLTAAELGIEKLYLFPFNQFEETVQWQRTIIAAAGDGSARG